MKYKIVKENKPTLTTFGKYKAVASHQRTVSNMEILKEVCEQHPYDEPLVNAIMIPITAYLTDRFSTKSLFIIAMIAFIIGSLLAAWGPNFAVLLTGRMIQACGAGVLMPMVMTVMLLTFPVDRRGFAMGLFGIIISFAPAIGPTPAITDAWHIL